MPSTSRRSTRLASSTSTPKSTSSSSRITKPTTKKSSHLHPSSALKSKSKMVSTRSSARVAAASAASGSLSPAPSASPSSSSPRPPTFPELVRARVAYSPAPSHGSVSSAAGSPALGSASAKRHPHWIQWPSQLAEHNAASAAHASRASSLPYSYSRGQSLGQGLAVPSRFDRACTADTSDLGHYAMLLQGQLRKGREATGSPV